MSTAKPGALFMHCLPAHRGEEVTAGVFEPAASGLVGPAQHPLHGRVALLLPNCPQFGIVELAAWKLGAIVAPLNPTYTERELEGPLRDHAIETVVTLTRFYGRVKSVQPRTPVKRVIATNIKQYFPPLLRA